MANGNTHRIGIVVAVEFVVTSHDSFLVLLFHEACVKDETQLPTRLSKHCRCFHDKLSNIFDDAHIYVHFTYNDSYLYMCVYILYTMHI